MSSTPCTAGPRPGMAVALSGPDGEIARGTTNADGRCPDLAQGALAPGRYALRFSVADYFRGARRRAARSALPRRGDGGFRHRGGRRPLSRAPARLALRLFDLPGQLSDGLRPRRMAQPRDQMAASDRGHRLDRVELLFRLARQSPEEAGRGRRLGRALVGPWRRLLSQPEIPGRAERRCPSELHWFKWEAYFTWISGFSLLVLIYYVGAQSFLIDPAKAALSPAAAIAIGLASLALGWLVYDGLCRSPVGSQQSGARRLLVRLPAVRRHRCSTACSARARPICTSARSSAR